MAIFVVLIFPSTFLLVSLIVSKFFIATGERLEACLAQASQKHKEFDQIVEVLKNREPDEEVRLDFEAIFMHVSSDLCSQSAIEKRSTFSVVLTLMEKMSLVYKTNSDSVYLYSITLYVECIAGISGGQHNSDFRDTKR